MERSNIITEGATIRYPNLFWRFPRVNFPALKENFLLKELMVTSSFLLNFGPQHGAGDQNYTSQGLGPDFSGW